MGIFTFLSDVIRRAPKVGHAYRNQVVEAIRVCHDLAKHKQPEPPQEYASLVSDFTLSLTVGRTLYLLEDLIEAAVTNVTTSDDTTDNLVRSFLKKIDRYPDLKERYPTHIFESSM